MTQRTFTTKSGNVFEWEETEEVKKAVEQLHKLHETQNDTETTTVG